jgi:lipoprotein-releasing system ATP-binding protein
MSDIALRLSGVKKSYRQGKNKLEVLRGASLEVRRGEVVSLLGPSGCGKSTLLQVAGLLDTADEGEIEIAGTPTLKISDRKRTKIREHDIGFVYQFHHLLPEFTALENVMLPQLIAKVSKKKAKARALELLEQFGLKDRVKHLPSELSGGEQQRVAIARALANKPALLLADEPTGNLDPETAAGVFAALMQQAQQGNLAMLVVTHNHDLARRTMRVMQLQQGVLVPA